MAANGLSAFSKGFCVLASTALDCSNCNDGGEIPEACEGAVRRAFSRALDAY